MVDAAQEPIRAIRAMGSSTPSTLYIRTVEFYVYRLRHNGLRLPRETIQRQRPALGDLQTRERLQRPPVTLAMLIDSTGDTYVIPPLDNARVRIHAKGIMIRGDEVTTKSASIKSSSQRAPQSWWCVLASHALAGAVAPGKILGFEAARYDDEGCSTLPAPAGPRGDADARLVGA